MTQFLSTELYNFVSHKHTFLDVEGLNSLFLGGENRDARAIGSNGSGKSLFFDAIAWCAYDHTVRGFGKDEVVGPFDDHTYVEDKWLDDDKRTISVRRYRNHKKHGNKVFVTIDRQDATKQTDSDTNDFISQLLGIDHIGFLYSVVFSRSRSSLCEETRGNRIKLLSHILRIDVIDRALKDAKKDQRELNHALQQSEVGLAKVTTEIQESRRMSDSLTESWQAAKQQHDEAFARHKEQFDSAMDKKLNAIRKQCVARQKLIEVQLNEKKVASLKKKLDKAQERINKIDDKRIQLNGEYKSAFTKQQIADDELREFRSLKTGKCPKCYQPINPDHVRKHGYEQEEKCKALGHASRTIMKRYKKVEEDLRDAKKKADELRYEIDRSMTKDNPVLIEEFIERMDGVISAALPVFEEPTSNLMTSLSTKMKNESDRLKMLTASLDKLKKDIDITKNKLAVVNFWVDGFGPRGLKSYIINSVLGTLEERANVYLNELTDGYMRVRWETERKQKKSDRTTDALDLFVDTANGRTREYHYSSDGEKARVWLSMELALNSVSRTVMDVAFIDECFDGLDSEGLQRAIKLIGEEGRNRKIICISHRKGVEAYFQAKKTVVMEGGCSQLEEAA